MTRTLTCLLCGETGVEGRDVKPGVYRQPEREQRPVQVAVPAHEDQRGVHRLEYQEAPEVYIPTYRCVDVAACADRVATQAAAVRQGAGEVEATTEPAPPVDNPQSGKEDPSWSL